MSTITHSQPSSTILQTALWNVQQAARRLELTDDMARRISEPSEQIRTMVHPLMPDGRVLHVRTFVVRHSDISRTGQGRHPHDAHGQSG